MGMYDTIALPCPKCGEIYYAQSKSGDCLLYNYTFENCPENVMQNVNRHAPFLCDCGISFKVTFNPKPEIVETEQVSDDFTELSENASIDDILSNFIERQKKLNSK